MVKLTITIPTFNRPFFIQRQVRDVLPQLREGVSLVVYDNCSDPSVESLFTEEEKRLFRIERNVINIGGGANLGRCLSENVDGWVWLLGDDDKIRPDAISFILRLIEDHPDCCYINTGNKRTEECSSFDQFLDYFRMRGANGLAFFQTACLFNMSRLGKSVIWYYIFLTSQMGQFYLVLKHMELNSGEKCFFTTESLITDKEPATWNALEIINNSTFLFDKFYYIRKKMRPTIFSSLVNMYFDNIGAAKVSIFVKMHYIRIVIRRVGFLNLLRYNIIAVVYLSMGLVLPKKLARSIHGWVAKKYNDAQRYRNKSMWKKDIDIKG